MESRRSELSDLEGQLKALAGKGGSSSETVEARREVLRKVVGLQTLGVDLSPLFGTVLLNAATSDVPTKKMLYHYLTATAKAKPDLALLTVNMLVKDAGDGDPTIRALALRSLANLRVLSLAEYVADALRRGLQDAHPYARKTAVMGVLKLHDVAPSAVGQAQLVEHLRVMLTDDPSPEVTSNCVAALRELDGPKSLTGKRVVYSLLNRLKGCSEWAQCLVLDLVAQYEPDSPDEMYDIMNLLEDRLRHNNSAVVLATVRVFLHLTLSHEDVHQAVYERIKAPLFTLAAASSGSGGGNEASFAVWAHLHLLVTRAPSLFARDYRQFFCRANDSAPVKRLKLEMLTAVADEETTYDIVSELSEYVADVDVATSRRAVRAVGAVALVTSDVAGIVDRLLSFLDLGSDYVACEALGQVRDLLRVAPDRADVCITAISALPVSLVTEPQGRAAYAFIMGEYGHILPEAPYALEPFLRSLPEEPSPDVRLELLTAAVKLFIHRPGECQHMLGAALAAGSVDGDADVRDRALMYYRLLASAGVDGIKAVVVPPAGRLDATGVAFEDVVAQELRDRLFSEFNSLSVIYGKPSSTFVDVRDRATAAAEAAAAEADLEAAAGATALADDNLLVMDDDGTDDFLLGGGMSSPPPAGGYAQVQAPGGMDLLGSDFAPSPAPPPPPTPQPPPQPQPVPVAVASPSSTPALPPCPLIPGYVMDPGTFQAHWAAWPAAQQGAIKLQPAGLAALVSHTAALTPHMAAAFIATMASGGSGSTLKWYFYAFGAQQAVFLAELLVDTAAGTAHITIKTDAPQMSKAYAANFAQILLDYPKPAALLL